MSILSRGMKLSIVHLLMLLFLYLFFFSDHIKKINLSAAIPTSFFNINTIFLSILIESIPFILIGVIASTFIQVFVSENMIHKILPRHVFLAMLPATLLGIIFPICECAIIPVVRRLIKKGLPQHVGIVFMLSVPVLNPVVFLSTYYAFPQNKLIVYERMGLSFLIALLIGFITYLAFRNKSILKNSTLQDHLDQEAVTSKLRQFFKHISDEFFETGKYLIIGAFLASLFHTFINRHFLEAIGSNHTIAPVVLMGFSYVLSICSEADAFVAASFNHSFSLGSILAFLVFGPILDLKNTIMLFAYFRFKFVLLFIVLACCFVYLFSRIAEIIV